MARQMTPPHKLDSSAAVIIRSMGGNGADDQRAALAELFRRRLWLGESQAVAALVNGGWRLQSLVLGFVHHGPDGVTCGPWATEREARDSALALMGYTFAPTPLDARPALPVIFRTPRHGPFAGQVTAYFPTLSGSNDPWMCTCYAHVGQHGIAAKGYYQLERLATDAEWAVLLAELRSIYERDDDREAVRLAVVKRWTRYHDADRRAELDRMAGNGRAVA